MGCIYLIRHGQVQGNLPEHRVFVGWGDLPLTPRGRQQAAATADWLAGEPVRAVYCSDLMRTRDTAEVIAAPHGLPAQADAALREANYGAWEGVGESRLLAEWGDLYKRRQSDPVGVAPPDGEHYGAVWQRLQPFWEGLLTEHREETVVVVTHNGVIRLLLCHILGAPLASYQLVQAGNCGISAVVHGDNVPVIKNMNQTCHLREID